MGGGSRPLPALSAVHTGLLREVLVQKAPQLRRLKAPLSRWTCFPSVCVHACLHMPSAGASPRSHLTCGPGPPRLSSPLSSSPFPSSCRTICRILESARGSEPKQRYLRKYFENKLGRPPPPAGTAPIFSTTFHNLHDAGPRAPASALDTAWGPSLQGQGQTYLKRPEIET